LLEVRLGSIPLKKGGGCDSEMVVFQSVWLVGLKIMMGHQQVEQVALFYEFSLEKHIPADHLLRSIDRFVEARDQAGPSTFLQ
jgi:hypothetical protein